MIRIGLTSDEQMVLISCLILVIFIIISYPVTLKRLQTEKGYRMLNIDLGSPEVAKMRLMERLQNVKREFKPIKIAIILYMSFAFILFLYFLANDIHGLWMFFVMISGSVVLFPLVIFTSGIKAVEKIIKKLD